MYVSSLPDSREQWFQPRRRRTELLLLSLSHRPQPQHLSDRRLRHHRFLHHRPELMEDERQQCFAIHALQFGRSGGKLPGDGGENIQFHRRPPYLRIEQRFQDRVRRTGSRPDQLHRHQSGCGRAGRRLAAGDWRERRHRPGGRVAFGHNADRRYGSWRRTGHHERRGR